jgi:hypothetical protein
MRMRAEFTRMCTGDVHNDIFRLLQGPTDVITTYRNRYLIIVKSLHYMSDLRFSRL